MIALLRRAGLVLAGAAAFCAAQDGPNLERLMRDAPRELAPLPERPHTRSLDPADDKIAGELRDLLNGQTDARSVNGAARLAVVFECHTPAAAGRLVARLKPLGGAAQRDGSEVLARVPANLLRSLVASDDIDFVVPQATLAGFAAPDMNNALKTMKIPALHAAGRNGDGIRIGIVDLGFNGYEQLRRAGRLPAPAATATFGEVDVGAPTTSHGTACAEIIHAVAPKSELFLARIDGSDQSLLEAAAWLAARKVDIVNLSAGTYTHELRGGDRLSRMVDSQMDRDGRLWVVAAGNWASSHWVVSVSPRSSGGWVPIGPLGEILFPVAGAPMAETTNSRAAALEVVVQWDDWSPPGGNASGQDVDACLYSIDSPGAAPSLVRCSRERQADNRAVPPMERLVLPSGKGRSRPYYLALHANAVTRPVRLHVFLGPDGARPAASNPSGSVSSPATARQALAVGALSLETGEVASYSSQGPTDDSRLKPDVVAPAGMATAVYPNGFEGTSASTPFVSGFAADIASQDRSLRGARLREAVRQSVAKLGEPSPNNVYGYGFVRSAGEAEISSGGETSEQGFLPNINTRS